MGIRVHRLRDAQMPEQRLDDLRVFAACEERCREGVTQGVEGEAFAIESGSLVQRLVLAEIEVVVIRVAADTVGEDEALILPAGFCLQLLVLACLVDTESGVIGGIHSLPPRLCA